MTVIAGVYICDGIGCEARERTPLAAHVPPPRWVRRALLSTFCPSCADDPSRYPLGIRAPAPGERR
jgi:hypothetical protein